MRRWACSERSIAGAGHHHDAWNGHHRQGEITTCSLLCEAPLDEARLRSWLAMIYSLKPNAMLRLKGIVRLSNSGRPTLVQAVGGSFSPFEWLEEWPDGKAETRMVLIFKGMAPDTVKKSFERHVLS